MPEGDTIRKIAEYMAPRLVDQRLRQLRLRGRQDERFSGRYVRRLFAQGKHLFIEVDNDLTIRSHLGMYGSWHRYGLQESWRKPEQQASLELDTGNSVFVCFNAKDVELIRAGSVRARIVSARLGPDMTDPSLNLSTVVQRAREFADHDAPIIDVLLDQRIAAGIGNVYKSELLFIEGIPPTTPLDALTDAQLAACYGKGSELLRRNLGGGPRVTRFEADGAGRLWVYGREGLPCLACDQPISYARLGKDHRATYWCRRCQR